MGGAKSDDDDDNDEPVISPTPKNKKKGGKAKPSFADLDIEDQNGHVSSDEDTSVQPISSVETVSTTSSKASKKKKEKHKKMRMTLLIFWQILRLVINPRRRNRKRKT